MITKLFEFNLNLLIIRCFILQKLWVTIWQIFIKRVLFPHLLFTFILKIIVTGIIQSLVFCVYVFAITSFGFRLSCVPAFVVLNVRVSFNSIIVYVVVSVSVAGIGIKKIIRIIFTLIFFFQYFLLLLVFFGISLSNLLFGRRNSLR